MDIDFDTEETAANEHLMVFMDQLRAWQLDCNWGEVSSAIHTLQMFVIKHMLQRFEASEFSDWYGVVDRELVGSPTT